MSIPLSRRLLLPLLAALAVHGLGLSWAQLQESQQRRRLQAAPPPARDNTPELLRFSRQAGLTPGLATVALPPAASLPPPAAEAAERPTADSPVPPASNRAAAAKKATAKATGTSLERPSGSSRPGAAAAARRGGGVAARPDLTRAAAPPRSGAEASGNDGDTAPMVLQQLRRQLGAAPGTPAAAPPPPRLEGSAAVAYRRLWNEALPARPGGPTLAGLPAGVESRRANQPLLQRLKLSTGHRQAVVLDDHLLLFWQEGSDTWLLRLPLNDDSPPE